MDRRQILKSILVSLASGTSALGKGQMNQRVDGEVPEDANTFRSKWHELPDMVWTGQDLWAQRLQDWRIHEGRLQCVFHGENRTVHILTHHLAGTNKPFSASMTFRFQTKETSPEKFSNYVGFRLGVTGRYDDYRSAIFTGEGVSVGLTRSGTLFIGDQMGGQKIHEKKLAQDLTMAFTLSVPGQNRFECHLEVKDATGSTLSTLISRYNEDKFQGNVALVSHFKQQSDSPDHATVSISSVEVKGDKVDYDPERIYGPIYFAQYTVNAGKLKLTAQLAPVDLSAEKASLWIQLDGKWKIIGESAIHPMARIATFKVDDWQVRETTPYKVLFAIPMNDGSRKEFAYEGNISSEPADKNSIKALACSCNWDYGFPDNEVVTHASMHQADLVFFLGDQFYEGNGGFGIQMNPLEKALLDYLRKWYMFGWSYRELFRNIPMAALLDDHDVYHGNIWGAGGRRAIPQANTSSWQDTGGYKLPPDWVNMAQLTQTSHMPDPFDAAPILQGINVYYTEWRYAGISFGIIEDRKFKSPPKDILPEEAKVWNGYAANPSFDRSKSKDLEAQLLGQRQIDFLKQWCSNDNSKQSFRVLVSATPFCCLQTLPVGTLNDQDTPNLPVPAKGEYVRGDAVTQDMDSNGWPHSRRNEVLSILKERVHLHLVGDQHLPSVVRYGVHEFEDNAYCFAVPALCSVWPRRWWPTVDDQHQPLPDKPKYTGNFVDGFGNKITVHAVASPSKSGKEPALLYDRVPGYGVVEFDKMAGTITLNCWPREVNPEKKPDGQYEGWPIEI
jgi:hypothetical protein